MVPARTLRVWSFLALALLASGCGGGGGSGSGNASTSGTPAVDIPPAAAPVPAPAPDPTPAAPAPAPVVAPAPAAPLLSRTFAASGEDFLNPERGFYDWIDLPNGRDFGYIRGRGQTLGFANVSLRAFRSSPISASFLDGLSLGFDAVRRAGIKVILRFKYAEGISDADAPKARVMEHIGQIRPLLQRHGDVIAVMQAGFIGAWGEWHASSNKLDNVTDMRDILAAVLAALPTDRYVQVRVPADKRAIFGTAAVTSYEAFSGADKARVGHHNDAVLSSATDQGTYPSSNPGAMKAWVIEEARWVPNGGEANTVNAPRTDGPNAVVELRQLRFNFLSRSYNRRVIDAWISQGYYDDLRRDLGYRWRFTTASWTSAAPPGGELRLDLKILNAGYTAPFNARPAYLVLEGAGRRHEIPLPAVDCRRWDPGVEQTVWARVQLPASLATGDYRLGLWLPDAASSIRRRSEYAHRAANEGVWDSATGTNWITDVFEIRAGAGGPVNTSATTFQVLP
jgi:hypothetical protein